MESTPQRSYTWTYLLAAILGVIGIIGLVRGDWVSSGYVLGAVGIIVWIFGSRRASRGTTRLGLFLAGLGVGILIYDLIADLLA